jgi:hypothetical protein
MSVDLSIAAVAPPPALAKPPAPSPAPSLPASPSAVSSAGGASGGASPPTPSLILPNPTIGLEAGLGVVVQLHNSNGSVTISAPTEAQLRLYRERDVAPGASLPTHEGATQSPARSDIVV